MSIFGFPPQADQFRAGGHHCNFQLSIYGDSSLRSIRQRLRRVGGQKPRLGKNRKITNADTSAVVQVNAGTPERF